MVNIYRYTDEGVASSLQIKSRLFDPVGGKSKTNNKNHQLIEENEQVDFLNIRTELQIIYGFVVRLT